jgi:hypothetical protein
MSLEINSHHKEMLVYVDFFADLLSLCEKRVFVCQSKLC